MDIEFVKSDDERIKKVDEDNCYNSTNIEIHDNDDEESESSNQENDGDDDDNNDNSRGKTGAAGGQMAASLSTVLIGLLASWALLG